MIIDTHAHYDDAQYDTDRDALLRSMEAQGVGAIINASAQVADWEKVLALTKQYPFLYGMIGVHPDMVHELNEENFRQMEGYLSEQKMVAVGEIGLDYYGDSVDKDLQKQWFVRQLALAETHHLPVNIHSRDAAEDTLEILRTHGKNTRGIIHCYSYSLEMAKEFVALGYLLGIGGIVTFKNAKRVKEVVAAIPLESLVLETDCPYLAPEPHRGTRNHSGNIIYVARTIGGLKHLAPEQVVETTEANARRVYQM